MDYYLSELMKYVQLLHEAIFLNKIFDNFSGISESFGILYQKKKKDVESKIVDDLIQLLFDIREDLRKNGDYKLSDEIRTRMNKSGLVIEDTAEGPGCKAGSGHAFYYCAYRLFIQQCTSHYHRRGCVQDL